ncbi:MAG: TlpA family protein disulfide reductase [Ignavibacteriae bacterium]|nr:TlpA family protein disulfide reductase [Ignavibacteriota bacterium]MCB9244712.1 TlpA family protein disulfide reductase [Ignavibacteriales bacterium]
MDKKLLFTLLFMLLSSYSFSQSGVSVGDKAPDPTIDEWVKGTPVTSFEEGKVYVVEFWGTWCGPCIENIPHLSNLQKEYSADGLTIIGVATHEFDGREALDKFMKERGNEMEYTVAYDGDLSMEIKWDTGVKNEEQFRLPLSFIIDRDGYVVFVGHPSDEKFDSALEEILGK